MTTKDWKEHLLSSGIPLEHSARQVLQRYASGRVSEFRFERANENGIPTVFSVDLNATLITEDFWLEVFVECKYRHDNVVWVFTPERFD